MRGRSRWRQELPLEDVFETQRRRIAAKLHLRTEHYRQRLARLGDGQMTVEVRGTSGGPSPNADDDRVRTSERALYGAW